MGTFTTFLNLLKPDGNEFVNEDTQLNDNWDIIDGAVAALDTRADNLETFQTAQTTLNGTQAATNTSDDSRLDALEGSVGTDSGWIELGAPGSELLSIGTHFLNQDSKIRRIGNVVDVHINGLWAGGSITPVAGGNVTDTELVLINPGFADYAASQIQPRKYTGQVGGSKYIATFSLAVTGANKGKLSLIQVDSNDEGDIVNTDVVGVDFTMFVEP